MTTALELVAAAFEVERSTWNPRPGQREPLGDWSTWAVITGRGWGKTRTGSEWIHSRVAAGARRIALVGRTSGDVREVMVDGVSGILATAPSHDTPIYEPSRRRLRWPSGAVATTYSAEEPDQLRGPEHDTAWCDEAATWRFPAGASGLNAWENLTLGLRLGGGIAPRVLVTTTPRRVPLVRELLAAAAKGEIAFTAGSTHDNAANLSPGFTALIEARYAGTRLAAQEIAGQLVEDAEGALWSRAVIDAGRVTTAPEHLASPVVAVDPSAGDGSGDECGIIVAALGPSQEVYVLADDTVSGPPEYWARAVVAAFQTYGAHKVIAEGNQGHEMVRAMIANVDPKVPVGIVHARVAKHTRAEPVAQLYAQGRVHHVGYFAELEDQLTGWSPAEADSPDRLDALVWAVSALLPDLTRAPAAYSSPAAITIAGVAATQR